MKTRLHFEAPNDLSIGTVRITGEGKTIADWVATPDKRTFIHDDVKPGIYAAEIGPAGLSPQSVVFEVREGQQNTVVLPTFSVLSASGSNTAFYDSDTYQTRTYPPTPLKPAELSEALGSFSEGKANTGANRPFESKPTEGLEQIQVSTETRLISIGISEEKRDQESYDVFRGSSQVDFNAGRLEITLAFEPSRDLWSDRRVRWSAAIEKLRIEHCWLPLYQGGTRITIVPSPLGPLDVDFTILPVDPKLRALVRALDAGTLDEATAVRDELFPKNGLSSLLFGRSSDPWTAILSALLTIRFPGVFKPLEKDWVDELVQHAGWGFDSHVIRARQRLSSASNVKPEAQEAAVAEIVAVLASARELSSPYYTLSNKVFGEIASGISQFTNSKEGKFLPTGWNEFNRLYSRWKRELPIQRGAGPTFTWLAPDESALKKQTIPKRNSSGRLPRIGGTIIFEGRVGAGQVSPIRATRKLIPRDQSFLSSAPSGLTGVNADTELSLASMPAMARLPGPADDPNLGRFGGHESAGAFRIDASFESTSSANVVAITITVEASDPSKVELGDFVWLVLHPTFAPSTYRVMFRGRRARLRVHARGGFTVGAWIPKPKIELECNLALIPSAPEIIKTR
ncbi:hypothetical protein IVB08_10045 [Bradyrhizobium sp. 173]|uniref:pYEATS domain-containing protein n=1 Tax=Bradyrhizobium sp. 173 TaxID=2782644 RepID=UPI001FFC2959|nr:pYEATS domain-containing protein [Bradyrhizobium sp. 173]MCK1564299.1 hypothetical protein [Bradyrhizobium sp. 173]